MEENFAKLEKLCSSLGVVKDRRRCAGWDASYCDWKEAQEVHATFTWTDPADTEKIDPVLNQFQEYCKPKKNVPFKRRCFNQRQQQPGETYDQYNTALKKLAEGYAFSSITPDEISRERLVFGIADNKVRERLLRKSDLTMKKTVELCHTAERITAQLKVVVDKEATTEAANAVPAGRNTWKMKTQTTRGRRRKEVDCWYCGQRHELN